MPYQSSAAPDWFPPDDNSADRTDDASTEGMNGAALW